MNLSGLTWKVLGKNKSGESYLNARKKKGIPKANVCDSRIIGLTSC